MTTSYLPIYHHSATRIPTSEALSLLSAYLEAATTDPSLHPNALLTESGPITPSSGANTGLVLHNLRRVEAGLKGEHLGADLTFEKHGGEALPGMMDENAVARASEVPVGGLQREGKDLDGGWQDKEEFGREQGSVQGELGKRDNAVNGRVNKEARLIPKIKSTKGDNHGLDKEARKLAKKERRRKEREEVLAKKAKEKNAEG